MKTFVIGDSLWKLQQFAMAGAAAIAAWLFTHQTEIHSSSAAWWLPLGFIIMCALQFVTGMVHLAFRVSKYIREDIEPHYLGLQSGFENSFARLGLNETYAYSVFWGTAIIGAFILPIFKLFNLI
jgi:hypothetical protein